METAADLLEHAFVIDADETMDRADELMQASRHEYAAVVSAGVVIGICSRSWLRQMVGGRYGFALYASARVREHVSPDYHTFPADTPLRQLLDTTLAREDEDFYHDIVITENHGRLAGLVSTLRLVRAQSQLMVGQYHLVDLQREELEHVNESLRESLVQRQALEHKMVRDAKSALLQSLAGGIAHEINNKLVPIMGYAELMSQQATVSGDAELAGYCETVRTSALESAQIIRQLLQLSKPSAPALTVLDLREPVQQALTFTQLRIKESATAFDLELPESEVSVLADATQIKQLVVNLVLNALDAMSKRDSRRLSVRLTVSGDSASLTVHDSGSGIAADCIDRIFDPFFTTKSPDEGTGLGLSVCSAIARQHDGMISVESEPGLGSTFTVTLPVGRPSTHAPAHALAADTGNSTNGDYRGMPALVVDDELASGQLVKHTLERMMGLDVSYVTDGAMAVEQLRERSYALVVSDMRMPKLDGTELFAWIKEHQPAMASRIVFITGDAAAERNDAVRRAGARVLLKPFKVDTLAAECRMILANAPLLRP